MGGLNRAARHNMLLDSEQSICVVPKSSINVRIKDHFGENAPVRTSWELDADKIIEMLKVNRAFEVGVDFDVDGLPIFADFTRYSIVWDAQSLHPI